MSETRVNTKGQNLHAVHSAVISMADLSLKTIGSQVPLGLGKILRFYTVFFTFCLYAWHQLPNCECHFLCTVIHTYSYNFKPSPCTSVDWSLIICLRFRLLQLGGHCPYYCP